MTDYTFRKITHQVEHKAEGKALFEKEVSYVIHADGKPLSAEDVIGRLGESKHSGDPFRKE